MKKVKVNTPPAPVWKTVDSTQIYEGDVLFQNGKTRIIVSELELDYGGCYYEGDTPSIKVTVETQILS